MYVCVSRGGQLLSIRGNTALEYVCLYVYRLLQTYTYTLRVLQPVISKEEALLTGNLSDL